MAWCQTGDKPLPEPVWLTQISDANVVSLGHNESRIIVLGGHIGEQLCVHYAAISANLIHCTLYACYSDGILNFYFTRGTARTVCECPSVRHKSPG